MEFQTIKGVPHYVFDTEDEFRTFCVKGGINPVPKLKNWREAEEGDWVISDDDRIVQILRRGPAKNKNHYIRTVVGTFTTSKNTFMDTDFSAHPNRYMLSKKISCPSQSLSQRTKITNKEELWVEQMFLLGRDPIDAYRDVFGATKLDYMKEKVTLLMKQERIIKFMDKLVSDAANMLGLDHEWVLKNYKKIAENAKSEKISLEAVSKIAEVLGTSAQPQRESRTLGVFQGFGANEAKLIEADVVNKKELSS